MGREGKKDLSPMVKYSLREILRESNRRELRGGSTESRGGRSIRERKISRGTGGAGIAGGTFQHLMGRKGSFVQDRFHRIEKEGKVDDLMLSRSGPFHLGTVVEG